MTDAKVYVPKLVRRIIPRNRKSRFFVESAKPLYPGYIFIELGEFPWVDIANIPFVTHIFRRNFWHPYMIPKNQLIMEQRVDEEEFPYRNGDLVIVLQGPFVGHTGRVVQDDKVELSLLGKPIYVKFLGQELSKVAS